MAPAPPAKGGSTHILARYMGSKLKKDALYQLKGRFFVDMDARDRSGSSSASYLHIDDAVRFQGPGVLRSFRTPRFWVMGEVVQILGGKGRGGGRGDGTVVLRWRTRDPWRRGMVYEQSAVVNDPTDPESALLQWEELRDYPGLMSQITPAS
ncbi:hypothetical protein BUE80_DR001300 [Diplocarpon rosae]|nr:hypothetical protein BUE80_DR001300 [Diplocarpon rosae]